MFDVNQITTTLRGMPDRLLQQYAMMNKANPYVLSLAVAESNQRKQLRSAAQARMATPQPKVADAAIAGMTEAPAVDAMGNVTGMAGGGLPEDQGIARIPAPNMQRMADGGIAGYGDDDEGMAQGGMFDFAQRSEPVVRMSGGGAVQKFAGKGEQLVRTTDGGKSWWLDIPSASRGKPSVGSELANKKFTSRQEAIAAYEAVAGGGEAPVSTTSAPMATPIVPYGQSKAIDMGGTPPPAPPPAPTTQQGLGSIPIPKTLTPDQAKEQAGQFADFGDARTALRQAELDQETQGARMRTTLSEGLPKTPALQGLEKLLDKQDAETGGEKDKAAGLALLSAGLAIAGGSSPFALQNLKEAIPAVAQYGDALKDIKKMQRENMKLRGDIEVARRAEDSNNLKLKLEVEDKILSRKDKLNDMGINLLAKIADTDTRTATELWKTSQDNASRIQSAVAGARASNMGQIEFLEKLGAASPDSPLRKGYSLKTQEGAEPRLYTEYIKQTEDPINGAAFKQKYPTFEIFKEGYSGSGLQFAAPPASASILKPPKG